ncbi:alpha-crystallin B chain [Nilaparvata lugens]|uniref:alpha-crystallin B chain n=1 Tax=Nilaparvata lugens TaxID=108931 RepID=UPI000B988603|nr:alpha-crystallin B chain [Nilaparvata lugens]
MQNNIQSSSCNIFGDVFTVNARKTVQQLNENLDKICNSLVGDVHLPPTHDHITAQLILWQTHKKVEPLVNAMLMEHPQLLNTFFKLEQDQFRMLIDVREFQPTDLKVFVLNSCVEVNVNQEQCVKGPNGAGYATRSIVRTYQLPQQANPERVVCNYMADGTLLISAPWMQQSQPIRCVSF